MRSSRSLSCFIGVALIALTVSVGTPTVGYADNEAKCPCFSAESILAGIDHFDFSYCDVEEQCTGGFGYQVIAFFDNPVLSEQATVYAATLLTPIVEAPDFEWPVCYRVSGAFIEGDHGRSNLIFFQRMFKHLQVLDYDQFEACIEAIEDACDSIGPP